MITGCPWPRFFDIGWEEEVQLHDGRTILVRVKYKYERLGNSLFDRYDQTILRSTEFSFDAGPGIGRFSQLFQKHRVNHIEQFKGQWYLLLQTRGEALMLKDETGWREDWGQAQTSSGYKCWALDKQGLTRASINDLPKEMLNINMLMDYAPVSELAALDGTRVNRSQKADFVQKHPLNPSDIQLARPT
jgi:hypothetical protein